MCHFQSRALSKSKTPQATTTNPREAVQAVFTTYHLHRAPRDAVFRIPCP